MAKLNLRIINDSGQTRTLIGKNGVNDDIVFHNDSGTNLTVNFVPATTICDENGLVSGFTVNANGKKKVSFVPGSSVGTRVKYTATIAGASPEDPIIIID